MLRAQVISQQNTQTENQNVVTMCHIKKYLKNSIKIENIENIRYFRTKISDIYPIYINDIYRRYISSQPWMIHQSGCTLWQNHKPAMHNETNSALSIAQDCGTGQLYKSSRRLQVLLSSSMYYQQVNASSYFLNLYKTYAQLSAIGCWSIIFCRLQGLNHT